MRFWMRWAPAPIERMRPVASALWMASLYEPEHSRSRACYGMDTRSEPRIGHRNRVILPEVAARRRGQIEIVDLYACVCRHGRPIPEPDSDEPLRADGLDFTRPGTRRLAAWLAPRLLARGEGSGRGSGEASDGEPGADRSRAAR